MKKRTSIKVEDDLMKEVEPLLEGTIFTTKTAFAADAIKEKIETVKKQQAEYNLRLLTDEFTDKQVQYRRAGINNIADLARTVILNSEDIKRLEAKIEDYKQTTKEMIATFGDQWEIPTHEEMKEILKEMDEIEDKQILEAKRSRKQN